MVVALSNWRPRNVAHRGAGAVLEAVVVAGVAGVAGGF